MTGAFQSAYAVGIPDRREAHRPARYPQSICHRHRALELCRHGAGSGHSVLTFAIAMFILGLGEAANFPACIKTVAEWFPKRERALATGLFNSGANIGNMVVPAIVPVAIALFTWRGAFVVGGSLGLVWLVFWLWLYRKPEEHPAVSRARTGADPERSAGDECKRFRGCICCRAGNLGLRRRQISHRPGLVVLDFLAARLFPADLPSHPGKIQRAHHGGVCGLLRGEHLWRLAFRGHAQARQEPELRAQDGDVDLRRGRDAGLIRPVHAQSLGGGGVGRAWRERRTRASRPTSSRWRPTCFPSRRWAAWWESAP